MQKNWDVARIRNSAKGEPEMQKLHGVGKFFNEWRADPPPPPKKGNISPKKEVSPKNISFIESKKKYFF